MRGEALQISTRETYYEVLQVSPQASQEVIHAAYRALARGCHPDMNPSSAGAQRMLQLNAAFDVLGHSERRAQYDLQQVRSNRKPVARPAPGALPRGVLPARSPRRLADERTASPRQRALVTACLVAVLVLLLAALLWVITAFMDDVPFAYSGELSQHGSLAPLNRFLTVAERSLTGSAPEFGHDATIG